MTTQIDMTAILTTTYPGRDVVVRSNLSGVWMGRCLSVERAGHLFVVALGGAQKIHAWSRTAATSGLAFRGPGQGSRVCPPVDEVLVGDANEVIIATASAMRQLRSLPVWDFET